MRGPVFRSEVCLDLDDAADAPAKDGLGRLLPDEKHAEESGCGVECGPGQALPRERNGVVRGSASQGANTSLTVGGKAAPKSRRMNGAIRSRTIEAVRDPSKALWISRTNGNSLAPPS